MLATEETLRAALGPLSFVSGGLLALSTTRVQATAEAGPGQLTIVNVDSSIAVYVGGATVTSAGANGIALLAGQRVTENYAALEAVYVVAASGTPNISRGVRR